MNILSPVGTHTYTPARLEARFTSSQSSPFVPSKIRGSRFLSFFPPPKKNSLLIPHSHSHRPTHSSSLPLPPPPPPPHVFQKINKTDTNNPLLLPHQKVDLNKCDFTPHDTLAVFFLGLTSLRKVNLRCRLWGCSGVFGKRGQPEANDVLQRERERDVVQCFAFWVVQGFCHEVASLFRTVKVSIKQTKCHKGKAARVQKNGPQKAEMSHGVKTAFVQKYPNTNLKQKNTLPFFLKKHNSTKHKKHTKNTQNTPQQQTINQQNPPQKHKKKHKHTTTTNEHFGKKHSSSPPPIPSNTKKKLRTSKGTTTRIQPSSSLPSSSVDKIVALQLFPLNVCAVAFGTPPRPFSAIGSACERHLHL